jgi:chromosome segregation ATPase
MAMLLMVVTTWGILANDGTSSTGDATPPPAASAANPSANEQINALKQQMALQQQQIEQMQKALQEQKQLLKQLTKPVSTTEQAAQPAKPAVGTEQAAQPHASSLGEVASTSLMIPQSQRKMENASGPLSAAPTTMSAASQKGPEMTSA